MKKRKKSMLNRNQVFLIILAATSIISAWILKDIDYYSAVILLIVTAVVFVLIWVYRSKKKSNSQTEPAENSYSQEDANYRNPQVLAPQTSQPLDQLPLDAKLGILLDRCIEQATTTAKLDVKIHLPLPQEIMYRGEKVKVEGGLTVELKSDTILTKNEDTAPVTQPKINQRELKE
jgi:Ca2+/Na+ antiporter